MLKTETVFTNNEWEITHRVAQPGDSWVPLARRNGLVVDVPADKAAFMARFPYNPVTDPDADRVFVYRPLQIFLWGRMSHGGGEAKPMDSLVACTYPADSWQAKLADTPPLHFPDGAEFFCCLPQESMLLWERANCILDQGKKVTMRARLGGRHRIILAQGELKYNGVSYFGPTVIEVNAGDKLHAMTKVYAAEVWV